MGNQSSAEDKNLKQNCCHDNCRLENEQYEKQDKNLRNSAALLSEKQDAMIGLEVGAKWKHFLGREYIITGFSVSLYDECPVVRFIETKEDAFETFTSLRNFLGDVKTVSSSTEHENQHVENYRCIVTASGKVLNRSDKVMESLVEIV